MHEALIIDACRTPRGIGKRGKGALAHLHPQHLGATVLKAIAERNQLDTADVDDIIFGTFDTDIGMGSLMGGIYWVINRRMKLAARTADGGADPVPVPAGAGDAAPADDSGTEAGIGGQNDE